MRRKQSPVGSVPIRKLLYHFFQDTAAVLFENDCDRHLDDATSSVHYYIGVMLERGCSLLHIVPNKQDKLPPKKSQGLAHDLREAYGVGGRLFCVPQLEYRGYR